MNFFQRLFNRSDPATTATAECPRCLGKGFVDKDDIIRLGKELIWAPGKCAYCEGLGKVDPETAAKVAVDTPYLTLELSKAERSRVRKGDIVAVAQGEAHSRKLQSFIDEIKELYFVRNLDVDTIAEAYLRSHPYLSARQKEELVNYIKKVVAHSAKAGS